MESKNRGKRIRLIERHLNGKNSVFTGVLEDESELIYTIRTDRGEKRSVSKLFAVVEWIEE